MVAVASLPQRPIRRRLRALGVPSLRTTTGPLRCKPDFLIIGTQKGGTTTLFDYLAMHPQIQPARVKEVHYFDLYADASYMFWYRGNFPLRAHSTGEASPYYLFHPAVPHRVARRLPRVKLIVLLRNPVDRAISQYYHNVAKGRETLSLEEALDNEEERLAASALDLNDPQSRDTAHQHCSYLARGRYAEQLERWFALFPRDQFLIRSSEAFFTDPTGIYRDAVSFLGLRDHDPDEIEARNAGSYDAADPAVRQWLNNYFAPHNKRLLALLGEEFDW